MDPVKEAREYACNEMKRYGSPLPILFEISEKKALELAAQLKADRTVVHIGACLMDLKLGQAVKEGRQKEHCTMGVAAAQSFLEKKTDASSLNKILNCIAAHHKEVPFTCKEAEICANADCYRFIHPKGFFAYLTSLGKKGLSFPECLAQAEFKLDEKWQILSLDACKKELGLYHKTLKQLIKAAREF